MVVTLFGGMEEGGVDPTISQPRISIYKLTASSSFQSAGVFQTGKQEKLRVASKDTFRDFHNDPASLSADL